jgi:hypothetical protein
MTTDNFTTAIIIIAPVLIVAGGMYLMIKNFLERDYRLKLIEAKRMIQKELLPLRLQAIERMVVFMERITPENLLFRILQPGMTVRDLQLDLLTAIRSEYEHNLSQQVYLSTASWMLIVKAKNDIITQINILADNIDSKDKAIVLSQRILESNFSASDAIQQAIASLKNEVSQIL